MHINRPIISPASAELQIPSISEEEKNGGDCQQNFSVVAIKDFLSGPPFPCTHLDLGF